MLVEVAVAIRTEVESQMEEKLLANPTKAKAKDEVEETARDEGAMVPALKGDRALGLCILGGRGAHRFDGSGRPLILQPTPQPSPLRRSGQALFVLSLLSFRFRCWASLSAEPSLPATDCGCAVLANLICGDPQTTWSTH